mmetsp:Transcript_82906/g.208962  ORF Transcript_82906/g.208962 Transcript_82906/m.208962 type:complete len:368 (+) Transcript_82906:64-1167(+)
MDSGLLSRGGPCCGTSKRRANGPADGAAAAGGCSSISTCSSPGSCHAVADAAGMTDTPSADRFVAIRVKNTFLEVYNRGGRRKEITLPGRSRSLPHSLRISEKQLPEKWSPKYQAAASIECPSSPALIIPPTPELGTLGAWSSAGILHVSELAASRAPPLPPPSSTPYLPSAVAFPSPPPPSASPLLPRATVTQGLKKADHFRPALSEAAASFNELAFWSSSPIGSGLQAMQGLPPHIEEDAGSEVLSGDEAGLQMESGELRNLDLSTTASEGSPSKGSINHAVGKCKPCAFVHRDGGCDAGAACLFCHLCDAGEKKKRRKERYQAIKTRRLRREANRASSAASPTSASDPPPPPDAFRLAAAGRSP